MNLDVQKALFIAKQPRKAEGGEVAPVARPQTDYSKPDPLGMFSNAAVVASKLPQAKGTPEQFKGMLLKQGVKPDEIKHSGFDEKLAGKPMVTRDQVAGHFHQSKPALKEKVLASRANVDPLSVREMERLESLRQQHTFVPARERMTPQDISEYEALSFRNNGGRHGDGGNTKFGTYTLPGGQNYREVLTTLKEKHKPSDWEVIPHPTDSKGFAIRAANGTLGLNPNGIGTAAWPTKEAAQAAAKVYAPTQESYDFKSSHWDEPNVLLHRRLSDRLDPATKQKILHLEELQSDWGQKGRKEGFKDMATGAVAPHEGGWRVTWPDGRHMDYKLLDVAKIAAVQHAKNAVPSAPYIDSTAKWLDLGLKRTLHDAAKGGYDKLVWTPGEEQAKRYDLSKHVDKVNLVPDASGQFRVDAFKDNKKVLEHFAKDEHEVAAAVGKEVAERLFNNRNQHGAATVAGEDLKIGGEGMKSFYDKMLPQALLKLAKKHDPEAKLGEHKYERKDYAPAKGYTDSSLALPSLEITPKMRASILKGTPHFASGGAVHDDEDAEMEELGRVAPNKRTKEQALRHHELHGYRNGKPRPDDAPDLAPAILHKIKKMPMLLASGGAAERQIGDYTPKQAKAAPNIEGDETVKKAFDLIAENRTAKAEGGAVEAEDNRLDKLCQVVEGQTKQIAELTKLLATPQKVIRDEQTGRVREIRRDVED